MAYRITDSCKGCTICAKKCPVGAISGEPKAVHEIDTGLCIDCGLCGRLCPADAVLDNTGSLCRKIPKSKWKRPRIDTGICAACSLCTEHCPAGCLMISDPKYPGDTGMYAYLTDRELCIGCGICEDVCPVGAIGDGNSKEKMNGLYRVYCHAFHGGLKAGNYFLGYGLPKLIEGPGSVVRLPKLIIEKSLRKVLIVTDKTIVDLSLMDNMLKAADEAGLEYVIFDKVDPNPTSDNVEEGLAMYKSGGCEGMIAFGGGSPMDCAKAIGARVARPKKKVPQLQGILRVLKKPPLIFAVPTTAGTGSETTVAAVITDSATHHKASINDPVIMPKYAVLDPELTVGLPPFITATTGMDALSHAVEAYTNHTYNTGLENQFALDAVKLIYENILKVFENGTDIKARQNMQVAAFKAGRAFTRGCVGHVHAIGHTLGGLYGVHHGLAMSVLLPKVMQKFGVSVHRRLAELADYSGMTKTLGIVNESDETKALKFIEWIEETNAAMGIPDKSDKILPKDIPQLITWASAEANPLYPVPELWTREDFREVIESISKL